MLTNNTHHTSHSTHVVHAGPLMLHIAKLVLSPGHDAKERTFYALGRVFAGTVVPGRQVRVLASSHNRFYWDRVRPA
jgi:hypothetical protein